MQQVRRDCEKFSNDDMFASPASGSAAWDAMVVVPCSMGCVGRIASGVSSDLIARAADVMLKEGRTLIVVPRETPLGLIHLRNLTTLAEAGAVVMPASPSFYSRPEEIEAVCATVVERIMARLGIDTPRYEWGK
jgi:4-hydroxy-3-polyprenylbenzoate decarboxylase